MIPGIDVSHFQGVIDWPRVAASGKRFAYVKAADGTGMADPMFETNVTGAQANGLLVGAYDFFRPAGDPAAEADLFERTCGSVKLDLPPVVDVEEAMSAGKDAWLTLPLPNRLSALAFWIQNIKDRHGVDPLIYTSHSFWQRVMGASNAFAKLGLWVASYQPSPVLPSAWPAWTFHQYSGNGACDGVTGQCDLDLFNGDEAALRALALPEVVT